MLRILLTPVLLGLALATAAAPAGKPAAPSRAKAAAKTAAEQAPDPAAELTNAFYTRGCGPVDQPVTLIYLTRDVLLEASPRAPFVKLWFAGGLDEHGRFAGQWDGPQGKVGGSWCRTDADCAPIIRGKLKLEHSTTEGTLNGEIEIELDGTLGGPLRALPLPDEHISCG